MFIGMINVVLLTVLLQWAPSPSLAASANAPWKKWTFCKKSDPQMNACLVNAIQNVENDLINGNSYFGTPPLQPLHLEELSLYQAGQANKAAAVNITFTNCNIYGIKAWQLTGADARWDDNELRGTMTFPDTIIFDADYTVNGKVILLPVRGQGKVKITFEQLEADMACKGKVIEKKGKKYFNLDTFDVNLRPKRATFHFANIFNSNTALSDSINKVLNDNWKDVIDEVKKPIGEGLGAAFKAMSNRIFGKIPYDTLIPQ